MRPRILFLLMLWFGNPVLATTDLNPWRLTEAPPAIAQADKHLIGRTVCGEGQFTTTDAGVRCRLCPEFTGNAGSEEGLEIVHANRGHFTRAAAEVEWLLDTQGCEAHYASFGGAILLSHAAPKTVLGMPAVTLGSRLSGKQAGGPLAMTFYKPGFRVDDCLVWDGAETRTLLVCNEADMAQGEIIGHISAMEVSRRGITRWRLLRWYDNSGSDSPVILSVVPGGMRPMELDDGQPGLQIKVKILEVPREVHDEGTAPAAKSVNLLFRRKGKRFYATKKTQAHLEEIGALTRKMLE